MYTDTQKRNTLELMSRLSKLARGAEPSEPFTGICNQRDLIALYEHSTLAVDIEHGLGLVRLVCTFARSWPMYSGDPILPVPRATGERWGGPGMWSGTRQSELRRDLCGHLAWCIDDHIIATLAEEAL